MLNRGDLLIRMISSIDYPVEKLCIVQNGRDDTVDEAIRDIAAGRNNLIEKVYIERPFRNMGVAPAWNSIIKSFPECDYWLIANNDTVFLPGDLEKYHTLIKENPHSIIADASKSFGCFAITKAVIAEVGLFDENIWPIYSEDIDYYVRMQKKNIQLIAIPSDIGHSNDGSWTIKSNQVYAASNNVTQNSNAVYVAEKWGNNQEFDNPWNHHSRDVKDWWYNPYRRLQHSSIWNHFEQTANRIR